MPIGNSATGSLPIGA